MGGLIFTLQGPPSPEAVDQDHSIHLNRWQRTCLRVAIRHERSVWSTEAMSFSALPSSVVAVNPSRCKAGRERRSLWRRRSSPRLRRGRPPSRTARAICASPIARRREVRGRRRSICTSRRRPLHLGDQPKHRKVQRVGNIEHVAHARHGIARCGDKKISGSAASTHMLRLMT